MAGELDPRAADVQFEDPRGGLLVAVTQRLDQQVVLGGADDPPALVGGQPGEGAAEFLREFVLDVRVFEVSWPDRMRSPSPDSADWSRRSCARSSGCLPARSREVRTYVREAGEGTLRQGDLEGGSLTVTDLGMYGVDEFSAIINPPRSAILAVGAGRPAPAPWRSRRR